MIETRRLQPHDIVECARCGKIEFAGNAEGWNTVFDMGVIAGFLCPECQTPEEDLEAQVNEATIDYSKTKAISTFDDLFAMFRPRWREALRVIAGGDAERGNAQLWDEVEKFRKAWNGMNRYNLDAQLSDAQEAYMNLVDMGELPEL